MREESVDLGRGEVDLRVEIGSEDRSGAFVAVGIESRWNQLYIMADVVTIDKVVQPYSETHDNQKNVFYLGVFVGDLTNEEDTSCDNISLEGLQQELEECKNDEVVVNILSKGANLREYAKGVENNVRQVELESIQDYIKESDNLVSLHDQIRDCDIILSQMETLLSGFQAEIGSISSDIKILQEKSMDMGLKLKNRKVAESKLAKFVEDIIVPPRMVDIIVDGEVNDEYMRTLEILSKKLKFVDVDTMVKTSKALKDVQPELERLRQKAVSKTCGADACLCCQISGYLNALQQVFEFIVQKLYALRKPKTNIQILQQSILLKYKYVVVFLKEHGKEVYNEVRGAYIDTMNKVLSAHFRAYIQALEKLQLDIATSSDLIGVEARSSSLFSRGREPLKNRSAVFALGERINILKELDQPALIPHIAEASSLKYPYEVLFRSLHKLLMDTATSEYLFCDNFFGEESAFYEIFAGPFSVIDEHFNSILPNCYDAIGLMLMIRIIHQHQLMMSRRRIPCLDSYLDKVNISLWPRFKMVFDLHLNSLRNANVKMLWEDDIHPHYVMRRYAEFTASLIHLNVEYGDGQLELNLERLRMAVDDVLNKLARTFPKPKLQTVFLINNYDMTIAVLKEAVPDGGKIQLYFEELLKSNTAIFVEELLLEHFSDLIKFVKTRASEDMSASSDKTITVNEVEPIVKDFASRWKAAIELMHKDVITSFSNFLCGMEILRAALTQLLLYYTRLSDCIKKYGGMSTLNKDLVTISSIMYEIKKYSRTF
ncbi:Vps52 [Dillenia turbinata]|uniref:Vps52 n=1 Tax=Dillenia turbinata TaxID=194707 RepID=A0AAN8VUP7_9MAGN